MLVQALAYMEESIPSGATLFTDRETQLMLSYYEGGGIPESRAGQRFIETHSSRGWRILAGDYSFSNPPGPNYDAAVAMFRQQGTPVWVVDGGWTAVAGREDPALPFTKTLRVFRDGAR